MALQHIPLERIDEAQLKRLITGRASETRDIEYKRDVYGNADKDRAEFLADISSFANTAGGDLVIGMVASNGIPTGFAPIMSDVDPEILRLEELARTGLQPRITNLALRGVPLTNVGHVLVVRVPRSYNPPHRLIRQGTGQHRFYARSSAGKYEPNVDELRVLFTWAPQLADRIRDFRIDRVAKIAINNGPVRLLDRPALIMHVIPFSSFHARLPLPLGRDVHWYDWFPPLGSPHPQHCRINVDGFLALSNAEVNAKAQRAYAQVFHSGVVEGVASSLLRGDGTQRNPHRITAITIESCIVSYSYKYLQALLALGAVTPFAVLVSLIGVDRIAYSFDIGGFEETGTFDRDQLHFSEVIVESVSDDPYEYARLLRPLLDDIANAAGRAASPNFNHTGRFTLRVQ
jgi:hypothetical protein